MEDSGRDEPQSIIGGEEAPVESPATHTEVDQASLLLSLPPELRNRIYEYALTENEIVKVTAGIYPPLWARLSSKQVRDEAFLVWFYVNIFKVAITEHDGCVFVAWERRLQLLKVRKPTVRIHRCYNWWNLFNWCKLVWDSATPLRGPSRRSKAVAVRTALKIAVAHRGRTYAELKAALENHLEILSAYEPKWKS